MLEVGFVFTQINTTLLEGNPLSVFDFYVSVVWQNVLIYCIWIFISMFFCKGKLSESFGSLL